MATNQKPPSGKAPVRNTSGRLSLESSANCSTSITIDNPPLSTRKSAIRGLFNLPDAKVYDSSERSELEQIKKKNTELEGQVEQLRRQLEQNFKFIKSIQEASRCAADTSKQFSTSGEQELITNLKKKVEAFRNDIQIWMENEIKKTTDYNQFAWIEMKKALDNALMKNHSSN